MMRGLLSVVVVCGVCAAWPGRADDFTVSPPTAYRLLLYDTGHSQVMERRRVMQARGEHTLQIHGIPPQADPTSLSISGQAGGLSVKELRFTDPLESAQSLFAAARGRTVTVRTEAGAWTAELTAARLSELTEAERLFIFRVENGTFRYVPESRIQSIEFPADASEDGYHPLVAARVESSVDGPQGLRLNYGMQGLTWAASYDLLLDREASSGWFSAHVGLNNQTDLHLRNARIQLVLSEAGAVSEHAERQRYVYPEASLVMEKERTSLYPLQLFDVPEMLELPPRTRVQTALWPQTEISVDRFYVYDGVVFEDFRRRRRNDWNYGTESHSVVEQYLGFSNTGAAGLGVDLPPGRFRLFQRTAEDQWLALGEGRLPETPADGEAIVRLGPAPGLRGERERTGYREVTTLHEYEETFNIRLYNESDQEVSIRVIEHLYRWHEYQIVKTDTEYAEPEPGRIRFDVALKPGATKSIHYTVRYSW